MIAALFFFFKKKKGGRGWVVGEAIFFGGVWDIVKVGVDSEEHM